MSSVSTLTAIEQDRDPILEALQEELIEAAEQGPEAVERTLAAWCERYPDREDAFRNEARAILLLWGLREPERLGQYQLLDVLTTGGMGKLYRAREDETGRIVVVKTILAGHLSPPRQVERFETERRLLSRLHDTHIVPLLATGREGYLLYMVMPFIPGVTLRSMIQSLAGRDPGAKRWPTFDALFAAASKVESRKRMDATRAPAVVPDPAEPAEASATDPGPPGRDRRPADYFRQVAAMMEHVALAVHHIHDARIVHRDLKPSNIMIESSGHAWVIDIGLGREVDRAEDDGPATIPSPGRTDDGMTQGIGTLAYMAPEQLGPLCGPAGPTGPARHDARTDVWGLGVTLYELLTLRLPFPGRNAEEVARKIVSEPSARLNGGIPRELKAICLKALEKEPAARYATATELAADLRRWLDRRPTLAGESAIRRKAGRWPIGPWVQMRRLGFWSRRRPPVAFALGLLAAVLLVGMLGAKAQLDAAQRELKIIELQQLRRPIRFMGWFGESWKDLTSLRGGSTSPDSRLQALAAATLEGIDARVVKTIPGPAAFVEFDPRSERLLFLQTSVDQTRRPWYRTALWDRMTYRTIVERDLGPGALAFRTDGTPLQLAWVHEEPPKDVEWQESKVPLSTKVRLYNVASSEILREYRSPAERASHLGRIRLSRDGSRLAAVVLPVRPDGDKLIPDGEATTIATWDAASDRPIRTVRHQATKDLVLSPDGRLLAAWDTEGEITVWTLPDGKELPPFKVGRAPVRCAAFGRDPVWHGDDSVPPWLLAVGESHGLVTVWDLRLHKPRSTCRGSSFQVWAMDFSSDGALLLTAGRPPTKLWDVATGTCIMELGVGDFVGSVSFARDGRHIATGWGPRFDPTEGAVEVAELEPGHGIHPLYGLQGRVVKTAFSPDGRLVAGASHEWQIGIWDRSSGRLLGVLPAPVGQFVDSLAMAFDADGRRLACAGGHRAELWDLRTERPVKQWDLHEAICDSLAFPSPDRLLLIRCETRSGRQGPFTHVSDPRVIRIYDLSSPTSARLLHEITDFPRHVHHIALAPGGSVFLADGTATAEGRDVRRSRLYDGLSGKLLHELPTKLGPKPGSTVKIDPSGKVLAVILDPDQFAHFSLFDLPGLKYRGMLRVPAFHLSPGATWSMGLEGPQQSELVLNDIARGQAVLRIVNDAGVTDTSFNFSPDDRHVAFGRRDGAICILDLVEVNTRLTKLRLGW
jgi:serine/threonine protein kinase/WD40 repeat protein